jgi:hypothetical protein
VAGDLTDNRGMVKPQVLSAYALRVLAEIHVTGLWVWVRGVSAFLDDPQHTAVHRNTVENLLDAGYLEEDPEELTISVSDLGKALLQRNPEAVGRATSIHEAQQFMRHTLGSSLHRPNSKSTPRP